MTDITPFSESAVPAHTRARVASNTDLSSGVVGGFGQISYKGKVWHLVESGNRQLLADPETHDPKASIELVIVRASAGIAKVYYPHGYEEGSDEKPTCYSNDGQAPALDAVSPQSTKCAICPHAQWGSRISETGTKGKACSDSRRLAVVAPPDLTALGEDAKLWLLRVPAASLKELMAYADNLNRRSAPYTAVVTKVSFDHTVAYPRLKFTPLRWLTVEEMAAVDLLQARDTCSQILGLPAGDGPAQQLPAPHVDPMDALGERPTAKVAAKPKPKPEPKPKPKPVQASGFGSTVSEDGEEDAAPLTSSAALDDVLAGLDD